MAFFIHFDSLGATLVPFEQRGAILQMADSLKGFFIFFPTTNWILFKKPMANSYIHRVQSSKNML